MLWMARRPSQLADFYRVEYSWRLMSVQQFCAPDFLTAQETAEYLSTSVFTLLRWDDSGALPSIRSADGHRYYRRAQVDRFRRGCQMAVASRDRPTVFQHTDAFINANPKLLQPQREARAAVVKHFRSSNADAVVHLPAGCGRIAFIAIVPFGLARRRLLVIAPNRTIRDQIGKALDSRARESFWHETDVLKAQSDAPLVHVIDDAIANSRNCIESHVVVTSIQQLASSADGELTKLPPDFFDLIVVEERLQIAPVSWRRIVDHFPDAKVVSLTVTPCRGDENAPTGQLVHRFSFSSTMASGLIKKITSTNVIGSQILFSYGGECRRHTVDEVTQIRKEQWDNLRITTSDDYNIPIVDESIAKLRELRAGSLVRHQIVAIACSIDHARHLRMLYEERGIATQEIDSATAEDREGVLERLKRGNLDCIVQVHAPGQGFEHPPLSIAAIFRPFQSASEYIECIGQIMHLNVEGTADDPANRGHIISHIGLNDGARWNDFNELDRADQELFRLLLRG
jgi:DNA repair protein RadD